MKKQLLKIADNNNGMKAVMADWFMLRIYSSMAVNLMMYFPVQKNIVGKIKHTSKMQISTYSYSNQMVRLVIVPDWSTEKLS